MILHRLAAPVLIAALIAGACSDRTDSGNTPGPERSPSSTSAGGAAGESPTRPPGPTPLPADSGGYDNARVVEHIRALSVDIGPRVAGSNAEREAVEYIRAELDASGYAVEVQQFSYSGNRFPLSSVVAGETEFEAYALQGSGSGVAEGTPVYVSLGDTEGIAGHDLTGAIAIAERGVIPFRTKYLNVRAAGAVALVLINDEPGALTNGKLDAPGAFPVVGVAQEDGDMVRTAAAAGTPFRVEARTNDAGESLNVLARAYEGAPCTVLVGGHHDTVPAAPGATDNASGVGHVLELARAMAADGVDEGLCFATFGAEESGLHGSKALVARLQEEDNVPTVMMNLDVTGTGVDVEAIGTPALTAEAVEIGGTLQIPTRAATLPPNTGSDHSSFAQAGSDVVFLSSGGYENTHSLADTFESVQPEELDRVGRVAFAMLTALYQRVARG